MRKLIILSAICILSFNAFAQVSQETYQNARKINKELKAKIANAEKEFKEQKATLDAELKMAQSEKPAELVEAENEYARLANENRDLVNMANSLADSIGLLQALIEEYDDVARENSSIKGDRTDLLKKVMSSAISFPLCFRYSDANMEMTSEAMLRSIYGANMQFRLMYGAYKPLLDNYKNYTLEMIGIFKEYQGKVADVKKKEDDIRRRAEEGALMEEGYLEPNKENPMQLFKQSIIDEIMRSSYGKEVLSKKDSISIPYLDDIIYELEVRTNISKDFLQSLIDKLQPK